MIQINLSNQLIKPLAGFVKPAPEQSPDLLWRADLVLIGSDPCLLAEELQSHYILVFCGLGKADFANFPSLFCNRLVSEAVAICAQVDLYNRKTMIQHLYNLCSLQQYQRDPEPQEEGRMTRVAESLERRFLHDKLPLPVTARSAFEFGMAINSKKTKAVLQQGEPTAMEAFGNLCLHLIEAEIKREQKAASPVIASRDNVFTVDFARGR